MSTETPQRGAFARQPEGTCYRVLMWESSALPAEHLQEWEARKADLLAGMRNAGIKGSRGKLAALTQQLEELTEEFIINPLATAPRAGFCVARAEALVKRLHEDTAVLGYSLGNASAEILTGISSEESLDAMVARWQSATEGMQWCPTLVVHSVTPADAAAWQVTLGAFPEEEAAATEETAAAQPFNHVTVLAAEAVAALEAAPGKVFVDATLGGGGHTERMLQAGAEVWGIDQDPAARAAARARLARFGDKLHIIAGNFRNAADMLRQHGVEQVDGLLADIGISSPQVDCAERGFSFLHEGPLDMRMNPSAPCSAADIVNNAPEQEIADILWQYGEERASRAIARRIIQARAKAPITTTTQLADLIAGVLPRKGKQHPATRSFQALRIAVNDELGALEELLRTGLGMLKSGGRFAVITFHSLEDRAVKHYFERITKAEIDRPEWPAPRPNPEYAARPVYRKPIVPSDDELKANPRSRSAKLRVIEKL